MTNNKTGAGRPKGTFKYGMPTAKYRELRALEKKVHSIRKQILEECFERMRFLVFLAEKQKKLKNRVQDLKDSPDEISKSDLEEMEALERLEELQK